MKHRPRQRCTCNKASAFLVAVILACLGIPSRASAQLIETLAGNGTPGYGGDGGAPSNALLQNPFGVTVDGAGNVYIADSNNHRIRVVNTGSSPIIVANVSIQPGTIATVAGNGNPGFSGDGGPATLAQINNPSGVAVDGSGNIYIADLNNFRVRKVSANGIITTVTGNGSGAYGGDFGPATNGTLFPYAIALDTTGNLYVADMNNHRIRVVNMGSTGLLLGGIYIPSGYIATVAGNGIEGYGGDGGLAGSAEFDTPHGVAVDANRNIYICDTYNRRMRVMNTGTSPITVAGVTIQPAYIATVAGNGVYQYKGDGGPALNANFADPDGIALDAAGNIYVSDLEAERIRFVSNSTGIINTIAGSQLYGYNGDNIPATTAEISYPRTLTVDKAGNVYFADEPNHRIREIVANTGTFTSQANTAFQVSTAATFAVTTNNAPGPVLTVTGTLPSGITFVDNGNGSGTLGGTPAAGTQGTYNLTFTASTAIFPNTTQNFTLTIYPSGGSPATSVATFVSQDITTQGSWQIAYGADGYDLATLAPQLPAYATVSVQNQSNFTWAINPVDPRALQIPSTSGTIAATWFNPVSFSLDVNVGTGSHPVTIYLLDWDNKVRLETIQILDAGTGTPLDTRTVSNFSGGLYLTWNITGHVQITATAINPPNSVISGIFFGNAPSGGGGGGTGGATPFLLAYSAGLFRNNFTGWLGMKVTVGSSAMNVTSIGRICVAGDAGVHTVKFVDASTALDLPGGSVSVNLGGCTVGQFVYAALPNSLLLPAGAGYYLVSQEFSGGDVWYDTRPLVSTTAALVNNSVYSADGVQWIPTDTANTSYGPPNFLYTTVPSVPVNVTVQSNPAGASFSVDGTNYSGTQVFNWTAGALHTIAAASSQNAGTGTRYSWGNWSDGGAMSHAVAPTTDATFTVTFGTQYLLSTSVSPSGAGIITANPPSASGFYDTGTQVQVSVAPASPVCTFSSWSGDLTGSTSPQTLTMSAQHSATAGFQCTGSPASSFLTGYALNGPGVRNNFAGWVGMKFTVGPLALSLSSLGRICIAGNSGTHTVKLVNASTGADVPSGSVSVSMAGCAAGQFQYTSLANLTLQANTAYYLVSQESSDFWYDYGLVASTSVAAVNNSVYSNGSGWAASGSANTSYVPLNFVYAVIPPGPSDLTITTSHSGDFVQGDIADTYTITVGNSGGSSTSGSVSVTMTVPAGLTPASITGGGWACTQPAGPCSRTDTIAGGASYPALTLTVGVASNAPASLTTTAVVSGGGETNTSNDTANDPTTVDPPSVGASFLTGYALNGPGLRNNYDGWVGMQFTVGSTALNLSSLGRICIAGNSGAHLIKLVTAATGLDVPQGSVTLNMSGCTAGQFKYASMSVTLQANTAYYLVSNELLGGDQWYDYGTLTHASVAAVNGSVYSNGTGWSTLNALNTSYVPVNFIYATAAPPPPPPPTPPDLTISITHSGDFVQADAADTYTITVGNSGGSATSSPASVTLTVPSGLIPTGIAGTDWTCTQPAGPCSNSDTSAAGGSYPALTLTVGVASNASSLLITTAVVSGGGETNTANDTANDSTTVDPAGSGIGSGTSFVSTYALNSPPLRNDYGGWVGMRFTVGASSLSLSSLGRMCVAGNSGTHTVKLVNASSGLDVASVSLNMAGCTAAQFNYGSLGSLTLPANTTYYLVSQETSGGDQWYDYGTLATTTAAAVTASIYSSGTSWAAISTPNTSYVPLSFLYAAGPPPTTLLTGFTPASNLRNDFTGWVGTKFTIGPANVTVHSLGRIFVTGNSGTHTVKLVLASDGSNVPGASVSLSMTGGTPGQFWYADLTSPVTLQANTSYYLVSQEQAGGDSWYDYGTVSPTSLAAVNNAVYFDGTKWVLVGGANYSYVPLDFK